MTNFKVTVIILLLTGFVFSACNRHIAQQKEVKQYYYTCPMHPDDIYYQPGKCLKCGMSLEAWDMKNMPKSSSNSHSGHSDSVSIPMQSVQLFPMQSVQKNWNKKV